MSSQPVAGKKSFTPGSTLDSQVGRPESTRGPNQSIKQSKMTTPANMPAKGKAAGSKHTPTSIKSNMVAPAKAPKPVKDAGIANKGTG